MNRYYIFMLLLLSICTAAPAQGQELYFLGGAISDTAGSDRSYIWALEYMQGLGKNTALSVSWLNEGHLPNNHRDGITALLWGRVNALHQRLSLAAGIGPYLYYDTEAARQGRGFHDSHGVGAIASLAGIWYTDSRWLMQLRANWVNTSNSIDTCSVMMGIGYQLDAPTQRGPLSEALPQHERTTNNEITAFIGQTISNSLNSQQGIAQSVEYRRGLARYVDWSVAWLYEGDERLIRRNGFITQLWAVREFFDDHLALGVGVGPYVLIDKYRDPRANEGSANSLAGIVTLSGSYRLTPQWAMRLAWNRITTNYNGDADIILLGPSYRF